MESYADLPDYTQRVVREEVVKELKNLSMREVAGELIQGKTKSLEDAMFMAVGKSTIRVCGTGAKYELSYYAPYLLGAGLLLAGYFAYQKEWK
jgi:hypothetical protein